MFVFFGRLISTANLLGEGNSFIKVLGGLKRAFKGFKGVLRVMYIVFSFAPWGCQIISIAGLLL